MGADGLGDLSVAFTKLLEKLLAEGLFDDSRKRPLPLLPRAIGVVTSPTGAALRDIVTVARRRHNGIPILLAPVQVQGEEAPEQIVEGFGCWIVPAGGCDHHRARRRQYRRIVGV
jgi:exodeoxyribonuclease VII large subunit